MTLLAHHHIGRRDRFPTRLGTILSGLVALLLVIAVIGGIAGLATYVVSRLLVSLIG